MGLAANHDVETHRQFPRLCHRPQAIDATEARARVLEAGYTILQRFLTRQLHLQTKLRVAVGFAHLARSTHRAAHDPLGSLAKHAGGVPVLVAHDRAAVGIFRIVGEPRQLHGEFIHERGVSASVGQHHRVVGGDLGEPVMQGHAIDVRHRRMFPLLLMPAATEDPLAGLEIPRFRFDHGDDLVPGRHAVQIEDHLGATETEKVPVPLDKARNGQPPVEFDHFRIGADVGIYLCVRAGRDDLVATHRDRLRDREFIVNDGNPATAEHQIGGLILHLQTHGADRARGEENGNEQRSANPTMRHVRGLQSRVLGAGNCHCRQLSAPAINGSLHGIRGEGKVAARRSPGTP